MYLSKSQQSRCYFCLKCEDSIQTKSKDYHDQYECEKRIKDRFRYGREEREQCYKEEQYGKEFYEEYEREQRDYRDQQPYYYNDNNPQARGKHLRGQKACQRVGYVQANNNNSSSRSSRNNNKNKTNNKTNQNRKNNSNKTHNNKPTQTNNNTQPNPRSSYNNPNPTNNTQMFDTIKKHLPEFTWKNPSSNHEERKGQRNERYGGDGEGESNPNNNNNNNNNNSSFKPNNSSKPRYMPKPATQSSRASIPSVPHSHPYHASARSPPPTITHHSSQQPHPSQQSELAECPTCSMMIPLSQLDHHQQTCVHVIPCEFCGLMLPLDLIEEHYQHQCEVKRLWDKGGHEDKERYREGERYYQEEGRYYREERYYKQEREDEIMSYEEWLESKREGQRSDRVGRYQLQSGYQHSNSQLYQYQEQEQEAYLSTSDLKNKKQALTFSKLGSLHFTSYQRKKKPSQSQPQPSLIDMIFPSKQDNSNKEHQQQQQQQQEEEPCSICYMAFQQQQTIVKLPCLHGYHPECVGKWFEQDDRCPMCKGKVG